MKKETKLKKLMAWLDENGIEYQLKDTTSRYRDIKSDLYIPKFVVSVKIDDKNTNYWFKRHKGRNPVVIRDEDSPKFVIEKVQNTITKSMVNLQKCYMREQKKKQTKK